MKRNLFPFLLALLFLGHIAVSRAAITFAGQPVVSGGTVTAQVPLNALQRSYVAEGGNAVPSYAVAVLAVPSGFTPTKTWPVLVVFSTSDFKRQNRTDLVGFYRDSALQNGWVVLAGDGPAPARHDSSGWRAGTTLAALDALHRSFSGSVKWPVACAGYSGGAKRAGLLAPLLSLAGNRIIGIFLTGINEDTASPGYRRYQPGSSFLRTPIFLSTGVKDQVAPPQEQNGVRLSMSKTGFSRIRQEMFPSAHVVKRSHVVEALRWFRQLQGSG